MWTDASPGSPPWIRWRPPRTRTLGPVFPRLRRGKTTKTASSPPKPTLERPRPCPGQGKPRGHASPSPRVSRSRPRRAPPSGRSKPHSVARFALAVPSGSALGSFEASLCRAFRARSPVGLRPRVVRGLTLHGRPGPPPGQARIHLERRRLAPRRNHRAHPGQLASHPAPHCGGPRNRHPNLPPRTRLGRFPRRRPFDRLRAFGRRCRRHPLRHPLPRSRAQPPLCRPLFFGRCGSTSHQLTAAASLMACAFGLAFSTGRETGR